MEVKVEEHNYKERKDEMQSSDINSHIEQPIDSKVKVINQQPT